MQMTQKLPGPASPHLPIAEWALTDREFSSESEAAVPSLYSVIQ